MAIDLVKGLLDGRIADKAIIPIATQMKHFPTYEIIRSQIVDTEKSCPDEKILKLAMKQVLKYLELNVDYYVKAHPDLEWAIDRGILSSARDHFIHHRYFEGRVFQGDPAYPRPTPGDVPRSIAGDRGPGSEAG